VVLIEKPDAAGAARRQAGIDAEVFPADRFADRGAATRRSPAGCGAAGW